MKEKEDLLGQVVDLQDKVGELQVGQVALSLSTVTPQFKNKLTLLPPFEGREYKTGREGSLRPGRN